MLRGLIIATFTALLVLAAGAGGLQWWVKDSLRTPLVLPAGDSHIMMVERGSSLYSVARRLHAEGFVSSPLPLQLYGRLAVTDAIQAGEYRIMAGDTPLDLLGKLLRGEVVLHRVTFPEGRTVAQWLEIVAEHPVLSAHPPTMANLEALVAESDAAEGGDATENGEMAVEGWFFPDTYIFPRERRALDIFRQAHQRMRTVLDEEWRQRQAGLPLASPYEALILASIVERETGAPWERGKIAGVFVRRLDKGMRLQTDPTVIYGLGERFEGNLTRAHLQEDTDFNTYRIAGLPPTPIANPGRQAIHAALNPEDGSSLYFVAKGDGSHQFSETLQQHNRAVREYQLNRRADYRSSLSPGASPVAEQPEDVETGEKQQSSSEPPQAEQDSGGQDTDRGAP